MIAATHLLTAGGVLLGALLSVGTAALSDRVRARRERNDRWNVARFEAYRAFMNAMHRQVGAARALGTTKGLLEGPPPVDEETGVREISESDRELDLAHEIVQLLGNERTGAAAHVWRFAVWQLSDYARGLIPAGPDEWAVAYTEYRRARDEFQAAVRLDLGISGPGFQRLTARHWTPPGSTPPPPNSP
ncbi:hypothetical protein GA0115240_11075 [Streptomyces sp. DvalAA-14]|nr:hypothetical protein GA0115240_11075 [Streptomyces sp. DvalAA-14]